MELTRTIKREIKAFTSAKFMERSPKAVASFNWQELLDELTRHAPMLMDILSSIVKKPAQSSPQNGEWPAC